MKYPIYIATLLTITIGASWAGPPSKSHYSISKAKDAKERQEQKIQKQETAQRPTTVALNIGKGKARPAGKPNQNQFQRYHHRNKGH